MLRLPRQTLKTNLPQLEQKARQAMMDPHFIFNVINSIQYFINSGDKETANRYLTDFAKLIRLSSGFSGKSEVLLAEEMAYLQLYLSFEKLRFGDNLTYEIIINPKIDIQKTTVAVMMIQPFLENAIWHGILPMNANGHVQLYTDWQSDRLLKIMVTDNGVGIVESFLGNKLTDQGFESQTPCIAIQRLKLLGASSGQQLFIGYRHLHPDKENKGTIAEFLLPAVFH